MTTFVAIAAIACALVLAWVLYPVWRSHRLSAGLLFAGVLLATVGLYLHVGTPAALDPAARNPPATIADAIARLETDLRRDPRQVDGWRLLGRAYAEQQQAAKARDAFARAAKLAPDNADVLVEYAESRALSDPQRRFDAQSVALLDQALQAAPQNQRARWFLGIAQRQAGEPADAARTWEPLLAQVDPSTASSLRTQIDKARAEAGLAPLPATKGGEPTATASAQTLTIKVALDPDFASRVRLRGDASVFVIARRPGGPPMPVAVEKHSLQEMPLTVTLDDSDGPMPTQKLSALKEVEVIARLSASGNAIRQEGDLESKPVRVALPAKGQVELMIGSSSD